MIEVDQIDFVNLNSIAVAIVDPMAVVIAIDSDFAVVILEKLFEIWLIFGFSIWIYNQMRYHKDTYVTMVVVESKHYSDFDIVD